MGLRGTGEPGKGKPFGIWTNNIENNKKETSYVQSLPCFAALSKLNLNSVFLHECWLLEMKYMLILCDPHISYRKLERMQTSMVIWCTFHTELKVRLQILKQEKWLFSFYTMKGKHIPHNISLSFSPSPFSSPSPPSLLCKEGIFGQYGMW